MKNLQAHSGDANEIRNLIDLSLLQDTAFRDGLPTSLVIEMPDGSIEPITYAWYDRERDMIRLAFDYETTGLGE